MTRPLRVLVLALGLALGACAAPAGPPPIREGSACATCGMEIHDRRFACERGLANRWRAYDSIECLMRDVAKRPGGDVWLADYDSGTLHAADSLWIAHGEFPSPMGAGYAAFLDAASAREVAITSKGTVGRLDDFLAAARGATP